MKRRIYRPESRERAEVVERGEAATPIKAPRQAVTGAPGVSIASPPLAPRSRRLRVGPVSGFGLAIIGLGFGLASIPPPGLSAAAGLEGLAGLASYALAGAVLAVSASATSFPRAATERADRRAPASLSSENLALGPRALLVDPATQSLILGLLVALVVAALNVARLERRLDDPLGPVLWGLSMLLVLAATLAPPIARRDWPGRWPGQPPDEGRLLGLLGRRRWIILGGILLVAALMRFPALGQIPIGIQADEGDRAYWALRVLRGLAPPSWFDAGWYAINLVYFHLLAFGMSIFGSSVAGTRALSAIAGLGFVAAVAWIGIRGFGWRTGLLAAALAATGALYVQQSRFIGESGITALLWAVSLGSLLEGGRSGRSWAFALAGLTGGLSLYFYPSGRLWVVGAALTLAVFWWFERSGRRWELARGAYVTAIAALIAVAPFLVHLHQFPSELTVRYDQTAVLLPENQGRLSYLNPPVSTPELLVLQVERTLGMFDRYPDGVSFLPTQRPAMPRPLGALTLIGLAFVGVRAFRDPRFAALTVWFWLGMSGVLLTVETPDFLRAAGALVVFPLLAAILLVEGADRLPAASRRVTARRVGAGLAIVTALIAAYQGYLYYAVYPPIMAPRWSFATQEGLQVARLGQSGPVYALEMYDFHVDSGWINFLAQSARTGQLGNPGADLPVLRPVSGVSAPTDPTPASGQGASFLIYPDANQIPYLGLLQSIYPGGTVEPPIDGRVAYVVTPAVMGRTSGVAVRSSTGASSHAARFGEIPVGTALPATLTWQAGILLPTTGPYRLRLTSPRPAELTIDGQEVGSTKASTTVVGFSAAAGLHFVQVTAPVVSAADQPHLELGGAGQAAGFRELAPEETYAAMDAPWGLLAEVVRGAAPASPGLAPSRSVHLDSTLAGAHLERYLTLGPAPLSIVWTGQLVVPADGTYRMAFTSNGWVRLELDGKPVPVAATTWDGWKSEQPGTPVRLTSGAHAVRVTLALDNASQAVIRWNWVSPRPNGEADPSGQWTVVPPAALRPAAAIWDVRS